VFGTSYISGLYISRRATDDVTSYISGIRKSSSQPLIMLMLQEMQQAVTSKEAGLGELQTKIRDLGRKETELRTEKVVLKFTLLK